MNRRSLVILPCLAILWLSCLSLDSFLFEPTGVEEYFLPADMDTSWHVRGVIPDSLRQPVELVSDGNRIYGFFVKPNPGVPDTIRNRTTVIYCHGKSVNINRYWGRVELLWEMGYQVFIFDYQGYGKSEGSPSGAGCYSDGEAALAYCRGRSDVDSNRVVYYGWSLGSLIATYLASDVRHPPALILEAPIASVSAVTREGTVLDIPGRYVAQADFDNEERITKIEAPVLIVYGAKDRTAVPERHAEVLVDILKKAGKEHEVCRSETADHSDIPEKLGSEYAAAITDFLTRHVP